MLPEKKGCGCQLIQDSEPDMKNGKVTKNVLKVEGLVSLKRKLIW